MLRLFVGLPVPWEIAAELYGLSDRTLDGSWLAPEDYHITLRFLGDVDPAGVDELCDYLGRVRRTPFYVELAGMDTFSLKRQTVLWAAVASTRKVTALAADINEKIAPLGFEMPAKPFVPHVTLARLRTSRGLQNYINRAGRQPPCSVQRWLATGFGLYLSASGEEKQNKYNVIRHFSF